MNDARQTETWLREMREHDSEKAFRQLFDAHYDRLFRLAFYYVQDDEWAKDIVIDTFAELWNHRKTLRVEGSFRSYSYAMVRNAAINLLNREQLQRHEEIGEECDRQLAMTPQERLESEELFRIYESALEELPERCREVFVRVKEEGATYAEVAEALGISTKTVDAQMQKALKHLRQKLSNYLGHTSGKRFMMFIL